MNYFEYRGQKTEEELFREYTAGHNWLLNFMVPDWAGWRGQNSKRKNLTTCWRDVY